MAASVAVPADARAFLRDPVLILPVAVAAGLAAGWLGVDSGVSGFRIAVDLSLAWCFVAASLVALPRRGWRRSRALLIAAGFTVLAADLQWSSSSAAWTAGYLLDSLWLAILAAFVLGFPDGRPWSPAARLAVACAFAVTIGAQLLDTLVQPDTRDLLTVVSSQHATDTVDRLQSGFALVVIVAAITLVLKRLATLRGPSRRAAAPVFGAALLLFPFLLASIALDLAGSPRAEDMQTASRLVALLVPLSVFAALGWSRLRRTSASGLVVELHSEGAPSLRDRLARTLGDPTLQLAYRLDDGRYIDEAGRPIELPASNARAVTLVAARGETVAALVHDPALLDEPDLVDSVRAAAGLVLENERLAAEVRAQLTEVRASRARIVAATDAERRRIERNLHDGAQQRLVVLSVALGLAAMRSEGPAADLLAQAQDELEQAVVELRELARGIHPTLLREEGLDAAVDALARRSPIPVTVEGSIGTRLPEPVELAAYFVVSESLTNVAKHASASKAIVRLDVNDHRLCVLIEDDGVGGAAAAADSGLAGLRDRLAAFDGLLAIASEPGCGTTIRAEIPCGS